MSTTKPIIFFSHSGRDSKALGLLKDIFLEKTGGSIDVFLSSDGQSIPRGTNWVHEVEKALDQAKIMFVFVTPASLRSQWLFFESGYAYSRDIRVIPIGFLGIDLNHLSPPLTLLQGFNITSEGGLNNLIAEANGEFGHTHNASFSAEDYRRVCVSDSGFSTTTFGERTPLIEDIEISMQQDDITCEIKNFINRVVQIVEQIFDRDKQVQYGRTVTGLCLPGISFLDGRPLRIKIDPFLADLAFPILERVLQETRRNRVNGIEIVLIFRGEVKGLNDLHKISGRLYQSDVRLPNELSLQACFTRGDIGFRMILPGGLQYGAHLGIKLLTDSIPLVQIRDVLSLLFDHQVLFFSSDMIT